MARHRVTIGPLPPWMPIDRLLGEGPWQPGPEPYHVVATLDREAAADVQSRLRGLGFAGAEVTVSVEPSLARKYVRQARTEDARRRRKTTPGFEKSDVRLDAEGRMSLTPEVLAVRLAGQIAPTTVIDAGCGVGGNAIAFARKGHEVVAIEKDPARAEMAEHNARRYGVHRKITFIVGDVLEVLPERQAGLLFCDPPWGAEYDRKVGGLSDFPFLKAVLQSASGFSNLWLKLPPSFDPNSLPEFSVEPWFGEADGDFRRVKFLVLKRSDS